LSVPVEGASVNIKSHAGVPASANPARGSVVATVQSTPITKATFDHWLAATAALSGQHGHNATASNQALKDKVMGFLITAEWTLGEAVAQGIVASETSVHNYLEALEKKKFKHPGELESYLAKSHETTSDLLLRAKLELIEQALSKKYALGKTPADKQDALDAFQTRLEGKWKAKTTCEPGYTMQDCKT
jgi:hypothetical protein